MHKTYLYPSPGYTVNYYRDKLNKKEGNTKETAKLLRIAKKQKKQLAVKTFVQLRLFR